jgi:hypothetical protein
MTKAITRTEFCSAPYELVRELGHRKGWLFVYLWLNHFGQSRATASPSIEELAYMCGMHPDNIRKALNWLCQNGWVERQARLGKTSVYRTLPAPR